MKRIGYIDGRRLSLLDDHAISFGTDRDITITPSEGGKLAVAAEWTVPGDIGRPLLAQLTTNVSLGSYANAFKAYVDLQSAGGATGLLSASCHEVLMALVGIAGTVAAVEMEMTYGATNGALSKPCFMWVNTTGDAKGDFDTYGDLLKVGDGISAGAGKMLSADSNTMRVGTGALQGVHRYLPLSLTENILDYDVSEMANVGAGLLAKFTGDIATPAMADGTGLFQITVALAGEATGALALTSCWLELGAAASIAALGECVFLHSDGIYEHGDATITGAHLGFQKYQAILGDSDFTSLNIWTFNLNQEITALIEVNDPANLGFAAGSGQGSVVGTIPLYTSGYTGIKYVAVYADPGDT